MSDDKNGLYGKYTVTRSDNSPKHKDCNYFVIDITHDKHAKAALLAYAESCEDSNPALSSDIRIYFGSDTSPEGSQA